MRGNRSTGDLPNLGSCYVSLRHHSEDELIAAANHFAGKTPPARIGSLEVAVLGDFIALVPVRSNAETSRLAAT
jgi:Protein of unknown function (DUF1045)